MAYPNYPYPGYPPYYPPPVPDQLAQLRQQQMQQSMMQQPAQPPMPPQPVPSNGINWCQGEEGAKAFLTAPGASVMLMDSEKNTFYIKSSDQSGMPLPLRIFDYVERSAADKAHAQTIQQPAVEYVTRQEFEALEARINGLSAKETPKPKRTITKEDAENG